MNYHAVSLKRIQGLLDAAGDAPAGPPGGAPGAAPLTVTISREAGALGHSLAVEVGRRLGWPVYDREIIDRIAGEMRLSPSELAALDERPGSWLEEFLSGLLAGTRATRTGYTKYLVATVRGLGAAGRCVLVGRGANF